MNKKSKLKTSLLVSLLVAAFAVTSLAGLQLVVTVEAAAYTEYTGTLNDAKYAVRFPDQWNGMLVIVCRGYTATPVLDPRTSFYNATANTLLAQGYAVAASTYGPKGGYVILSGVDNSYKLTRYLTDTYRISKKVFIIGVSMGGAVALLLAEKYPETYSGVLDLAGLKDLKDQYAYKTLVAGMPLDKLQEYLAKTFGGGPPAPLPVLQGLKDYCNSTAANMVIAAGGTPEQKPTEYEDMSPTYHANIAIPIVSVHSTGDAIVPLWQTNMYQAAVARAGHSSLFRMYATPPVPNGTGHADANVIAQISPRFVELVSWSNAPDEWTSTVTGRSLKAYPDLKETIWQKNATMPPNGQYDKIGLHRLVKTSDPPKGVILLCPGTNGNAEQLFSNPPSDKWTKYENFSQPIYWANRGFDVYGMDYRTHFVPIDLNSSQLSFMANWGYSQWMSDLKEAVEKVKEVSGHNKIFLAGISFGGNMVMNHAARYWQEDLRGVILLDGGPGTANPAKTNTYNLTAALAQMNANGTWGNEFGAPLKGSLFVMKYALENPGAPAVFPGTNNPLIDPFTNQTFANITAWLQGYYRSATSNTNLTGGYGDMWVMTQYFATNDRYWPARLSLERNAWWDWTNCPYVEYDYDDHYIEINIPLLGFTSQNYGVKSWGKVSRGISSYDVTGITLPYYGHLDVFLGVRSAGDISQPTMNWVLGEMSGLKATAFTSVNVPSGWRWNFFVHSTGGFGAHNYQWYEGTAMLQGQTSMLLPVTKNTPGTYTFYCKVTDAESGTTQSNTVTLTVW